MSTALVQRDVQLDRYIAEVGRYPLLSRDEELTLARRFRNDGDVSAAHSLVVSNLRFVVKVAHEFRGYSMRLLDLIQEGNIGLMQAVKKFDPEKGYRLISYAVWWIRAHIQSFIMKTWSLVKLGSGRVRRHLFFKLRSQKSRMEQEAESEGIDTKELAKELGVTQDEISEMEVRMAGHDFSLDAPIGADADVTHLEQLADADTQETVVAAGQEQRLLESALAATRDTLDKKERIILDKRLLNDEPLTLAEIGTELNLTRERVRQIEEKLIGKLRAAMPRAALSAAS
jgi:RNA polymerase sigma-32 factor